MSLSLTSSTNSVFIEARKCFYLTRYDSLLMSTTKVPVREKEEKEEDVPANNCELMRQHFGLSRGLISKQRKLEPGD
jgi:hypothetical protein